MLLVIKEEIEQGKRAELNSEDRARMKQLERGERELKRANEIA